MLLPQRLFRRSYWYLSDSVDSSDGVSKPNDRVGRSCCDDSPWLPKPSSILIIDEMIREAKKPLNRRLNGPTANDRASLESGLTISVQPQYTFWPSSIWGPNFLQFPEEEIIFEGADSNMFDVVDDCASKKSAGTLETTFTSSTSSNSSSPECQHRWDLHDLDLSLIEIDGENFEIQHEDVKYFDDLFEDSSSFELAKEEIHLEEPKKKVRFANQIETVFVVSDLHDDRFHDPSLKKVIILFLCPDEKKYEIVHAEYQIDKRVQVSCLLKQCCGWATDPMISNQHYNRLCRADGGCELINALSIQDYELDDGEILIGVLEGYTGHDFTNWASKIIENKEILRVVKRTTRPEFTLHRVKCTDEERDGLKSRISLQQQQAASQFSINFTVTLDGCGPSSSFEIGNDGTERKANEGFDYITISTQSTQSPPQCHKKPKLPSPVTNTRTEIRITPSCNKAAGNDFSEEKAIRKGREGKQFELGLLKRKEKRERRTLSGSFKAPRGMKETKEKEIGTFPRRTKKAKWFTKRPWKKLRIIGTNAL